MSPDVVGFLRYVGENYDRPEQIYALVDEKELQRLFMQWIDRWDYDHLIIGIRSTHRSKLSKEGQALFQEVQDAIYDELDLAAAQIFY